MSAAGPSPSASTGDTRRLERLVLLGSVIVDVVLFVPELPPPGGDVLAHDSRFSTGGGYNVMSAASRQGLPAGYAGRHGTGSFGDQVRRDLAVDDIELLLPVTTSADTGFCVGLVDAAGRPTFVTREGTEGSLTPEDLAGVRVGPGDVVYLSGYDLAYSHAEVVAEWFAALDNGILTIFDPGPLLGELPRGPLDRVLGRADWVSANQSEASLLSGVEDPAAAAAALGRIGVGREGIIVRAGAQGCWLASRAAEQLDYEPGDGLDGPGEPGEPGAGLRRLPAADLGIGVIDTSGAGDTHVGAFVAALGRGENAVSACQWANAAAARCIAVKGSATAPALNITRADVQRWQPAR